MPSLFSKKIFFEIFRKKDVDKFAMRDILRASKEQNTRRQETMKAEKIIEIIDNAQQVVEFGVRFNANEAAKKVCDMDENSAETMEILTSFLKNVESYEGRISRDVYEWARNYDGLTVDRDAFGCLHHIHPALFDGFLKAYIKLQA